MLNYIVEFYLLLRRAWLEAHPPSLFTLPLATLYTIIPPNDSGRLKYNRFPICLHIHPVILMAAGD